MSKMKNKKNFREILILVGIYLLFLTPEFITELFKKDPFTPFPWFLFVGISPIILMLMTCLVFIYYKINLLQYWYIIIMPIAIIKGIDLCFHDFVNSKGIALILAGSSCFLLTVIFLGIIIFLIKTQGFKISRKEDRNIENVHKTS